MFNIDVYTRYMISHMFLVLKAILPGRNKHDAKQHATLQNTKQRLHIVTQKQHQEI